MFPTLSMRLEGVSPLLQHNIQLANPLNQWSRAMRAITSKRKKTEEDLEELARLEFMGGLYYDTELGPYIPSENVLAAIRDSARLDKRGRDIDRAVTADAEMFSLEYDGPRTPDALWAAGAKYVDCRAVRVNAARCMRYRPRFPRWSSVAVLRVNPEIIEPDAVVRIAERAGALVGLGDFRRKYGRFAVEVL